MNINTKEFGEIEIQDNDIINFKGSIYGFEKYKKYVILNNSPEDSIMYLQSVENEDLHFVIVDPYAIFPLYTPILNDEDYKNLEITKGKHNKLKYMLIAVISENMKDSVVNLKSPIVINPDNRLAVQSILQNQDYCLRYPLFQKKEDGE
ncbi:flagellar assembly protein FliW [Sedimentibacter sp. zth1]|uniref:flagellar assembly protein FliW n=1 Tax=Sedimentibacter sp. zth1 TaxID=2816908 RepID=UPI001A920AB1|nr:flagellar assembly protein FliW [Sedimentibacter sp. zth1]QSX06028.1 flagellar assembly protein FliW [Sedimentibacter sp. zth1]